MLMETLLCILLYLGAIISPGTYSYQQIDDYETANQAAINQIHANPGQEAAIVQTYTPELEWLDLWDDDADN